MKNTIKENNDLEANEKQGKKSNKIIRYETNPFIGTTTIKTREKWIKIGAGNNVLVDNSTGEVLETTNVVAVREVDDEMFIKLFTQNIGLMMDLNTQGIKALGFLIWVLQNYSIRSDMVHLNPYTYADFMKAKNPAGFSERTMYFGINQLCKAKILARSKSTGIYFINPNFIFNGDRMRFVTEIRRKRTNKQALLEEAGQTRLLD